MAYSFFNRLCAISNCFLLKGTDMNIFSLLSVIFIMRVAAVLFILCAVVLILVILIQKGKGGGLSAAFGGGMASGILGADTKKPMTWFTICLVAIFLLLGIVMAKFYRPSVSDFDQAPAVEERAPGSAGYE